MKAVIIRHCETDWNAEGNRIQGSIDTELNKNGAQQAHILAKELMGMGINQIISSDLKRASQTADIISSNIHAPIQLDQRLRECHFGKFQGKTWQEIEEKYSIRKLDVFKGEEKEYTFAEFGGESRAEVETRHLDLFNELKTEYPNKTILLVGHGTGLNTLLSSLGYKTGLERGEYRIIESV